MYVFACVCDRKSYLPEREGRSPGKTPLKLNNRKSSFRQTEGPAVLPSLNTHTHAGKRKQGYGWLYVCLWWSDIVCTTCTSPFLLFGFLLKRQWKNDRCILYFYFELVPDYTGITEPYVVIIKVGRITITSGGEVLGYNVSPLWRQMWLPWGFLMQLPSLTVILLWLQIKYGYNELLLLFFWQ